MKTKDYLRKYFPVITIALVLIASTLEAGAEDHQKEGRREKESDHERQEYRHNEQTVRNEQRGRNEEYREERNYASRDNRNEYHPSYSKKNYHRHSDYYKHPRYGRVYSRFDHNPVVFRHPDCDYYYYGDNFYRYRDGIGYCVVEPPRHEYFRHLPVECHKVYINGQVFFRNGDLFFESSPRGYILVPSPLEIRFTARF
jgi:hypothetical protein